MAALLLACVWCLLLCGAALRAPLGVTYLACTALLVWTRPRASARPSSWAELLAGAAGFVALPAWLAGVAVVGRLLGLPPPAPPVTAPAGADWAAHGALAPLFEELLYRERLLPALRARAGAPLALVLSSAAFAAPHLEAWSVLTTFGVGLALGGLFLATGRIGPCIAAHAGLNAAALACGLPPRRWALAPELAALAAGGLLAFALASTRVHAERLQRCFARVRRGTAVARGRCMSIGRRPRFAAALAVAFFLALTHAAFPDGAERAPAQYALVITLGYGHLLGAALPAFRRSVARGTLACAWRLCAAATAFALYASAVAAWPPLVLGLVALSVWHIAENDAAMARVLRAGGALRRLPPGAAGHALPFAAAALVLGLARWALPDPGRFGDVFSGVTLYHLVAWLAFARARGASTARLAALHAGPALACGALWLAPEPGAAALRALAFSPAIYLFWSALHVLQTARARAVA
jgi:membrane protease YdiL (CAAX protease family)